MQTLMTTLFCANLGYTDVSFLLGWWFVDDTLERHIWNIDISDGNIFDLYCFCCVNFSITDVSLLVHWRFVDDSLKKHWSYSEDFHANHNDHEGFYWPNLRNIDVSLLLCRWSLMILWRDVIETLIIS